jgi:hypothetical protein
MKIGWEADATSNHEPDEQGQNNETVTSTRCARTHSFQGVRKVSLRRCLGSKAQLEVEASRRLGKWSKVTLCRRRRRL